MAETQKERIMRILGVNSEEADSILADDKDIDRGKRMEFDLSPEQERAAKKYANTGTRKTPIRLENGPRKRKENPTKAGIIAALFAFLQENSELEAENVTVTNKERQVAFRVGDSNYELTLVQKRPPKV